jgi:hypothetical protein
MAAWAEPTYAHLAPPTHFEVVGAEFACVQPATAAIELNTPTRIYSPKKQRDVTLKLHVVSVYFKCFKYVVIFYIDIAKVNQNVVYIAIVFSSVCPKCFIYFKRMLQCFIWMLQK